MRKANKGEWSEFYAFLKILFDHKLFSADETYTIIPDSFLNVLSVLRKEDKSSLKYQINNEKEEIAVYRNDTFITSIPIMKIGKKLACILEKIQKGGTKEGSFSIPETEELINELHCKKIKAESHQKTDITIIVKDNATATVQERGFSIKSKLGKPATLFNAAKGTNFIFVIEKTSDDLTYGPNPRIKIKDILRNDHNLKFKNVSNINFERNLELIDSNMPLLLSQVVKYYFMGHEPSIKNLTRLITKIDPLKKNNPAFYRHKIQELLISIAFGFKPTEEWNGETATNGGYIVVKKNGELACYHIYERDRFKNYLFENTKLETPSRTKHDYGILYEEKGEKLIKLNLQIRFTN